jgi:spore coat protein SA
LSLSVTIITPGSFPIPSTVTSSVESSVMNLTPFLAKNVSVTVLGRKFTNGPKRIEMDGVNYINFTSLNKRDYLSQAIQYLIQNPTTIIQIENRPAYVELIKRKIPESKIWLSLHSVTFLQSKTVDRKLLTKTLQLADRIIVNSQFIKEYVSGIVSQVEQKIIVNHLGVNPDLFISRYDSEMTKLREKDFLQLKLEGKKIILFVGRLQKKKGVHQLLKAVSLLEKRFNNFVLLVVGSHTYGKNIKTKYIRYLRRLAKPYSAIILHVPYVSADKIQRYYRLADVVAVPSTGPEAFGLVNLEAMATEVPVVATNIGGIPEIIRNRENGLLLSLSNHVQEMTDALYNILSDDKWARELGKKGREDIVQYFSWEHAANRLYQHYLNEVEIDCQL